MSTNVAETAQAHEDPRLRGRTYAIPFEDVWNAAMALATVGLRRWRVVASDDEEGVIRAEATTFWRKRIDDVVIRVTLDENAQTRVDASSATREGSAWGRNERRLRRFFEALDKAVIEARRQRLGARKGPGATAGRA